MNKRNFQALISWLLLAAVLAGCAPSAAVESTRSTKLLLKGRAIVAQGNYAYFAVGSRIQAIDVSNPTAPTLVGEVKTRLPNSEIVLLNDRVYGINSQYASPSRGADQVLSIVDVSHPASMRIVAAYEPENMNGPQVNDMTVLGDTAYVMLGFQAGSAPFAQGLLALDIGDPGDLKKLALDTTIPAIPDGQITAVDASTFYISAENGMRIFRLENNAQWAEAGSVDCKDCRLLSIDGSDAYFQAIKYQGQQTVSTITSYDIGNPLAPVQKEHYQITDVYGSTVRKSKLYATDKDGNLRIYSLGEKGNISELGFFDSPEWIRDLFVSDSIVYLAAGYQDMVLLDISNPSAPAQIARYNAFGYTFEKKPATVPDPLDTTPPSCTSINEEHPIGAAPDTLMEIDVPLVATDTQNSVAYMRSGDGQAQWSDWMPYQSPYKIVASIPTNWASVGIWMQYRDSAGNVSEPCSWRQVTEGW